MQQMTVTDQLNDKWFCHLVQINYANKTPKMARFE